MLSQRVFVYIPNRFNTGIFSRVVCLSNSGIATTTNSFHEQRHTSQITTKRNFHGSSKTYNQNLINQRFSLHNYRSRNANSINSCRWLSQQKILQEQFENTAISGEGVSRPLVPHVDPKYSYAFGKSIDNLTYSTISKELGRVYQETGGQQMSIISDYEGIAKSLGEFKADVDTMAKSLMTRFNLKKGDSVGIFGYNSYNWLVAQFACARSGMVLVPINPSYKSEELAFVLQSARVKCLFTNGPNSIQTELNKHLELLKSPLVIDKIKTGEIQLREIILMDGSATEYAGELQKVSKGDKTSSLFVDDNCKLHHWSECMQNGRLYSNAEEAIKDGKQKDKELIVDQDYVSPDDLFAIYYTSGTTGTPKGACVSHFTALNNSLVCYRRLTHGMSRDTEIKFVTVLPFFHIFAGVLLAFPTQFSKTVMVLPSYRYDIEAMVKSAIKHQTNVTSITPTILTDMLRYINEKKMGSQIPIKIVQSGGAALPPELVNRSFDVLDQLEQLRIGYGSTENGGVATMQTILEPDETRAISVGPPVDFSEIRVVSLEKDDQLVELGQKGEIQTRGHNTMRGYLDDQAKTNSVIMPTKWYKTGDIGVMHPNGSVQIVGRLKSLIIRGGENIYPDEVERFIYQLSYVDTVFVIGIPDKRMGEEVCAWIKLKPGYCESGKKPDGGSACKEVTKEEVIKFCAERMTYFKVPKYILFVDEFPMTPTKKAQAHLMTNMTIKMLGLGEK